MAHSSLFDTDYPDSISQIFDSHEVLLLQPLPDSHNLDLYTPWFEQYLERALECHAARSDANASPLEAFGEFFMVELGEMPYVFVDCAAARLLLCLFTFALLVSVRSLVRIWRRDGDVDDGPVSDQIERASKIRGAPVMVQVTNRGGSHPALVFMHFKQDVLRAMEDQLLHDSASGGGFYMRRLVEVLLPGDLEGLFSSATMLRCYLFFAIDISTLFDICPLDAYVSLKFRETPGVCPKAVEDDDIDLDNGWITVTYRRRRRCRPANIQRITGVDVSISNETKRRPGGAGSAALSLQRGWSINYEKPSKLPSIVPAALAEPAQDDGSRKTAKSTHGATILPASTSTSNAAVPETDAATEMGTSALDTLTLASDRSGTPASPALVSTIPKLPPNPSIPSPPGPKRSHRRAFTAPAAHQPASRPSSSSARSTSSTQRWPQPASRLPRGQCSTSLSSNSSTWRSRQATATPYSAELVLAARRPITSGDSLTCFQVTLYSMQADLVLSQSTLLPDGGSLGAGSRVDDESQTT